MVSQATIGSRWLALNFGRPVERDVGPKGHPWRRSLPRSEVPSLLAIQLQQNPHRNID